MPRKVKDLIRDLLAAGFVNRGGKGSHRNFLHPKCPYPVTISGRVGEDAKPYQEKALKVAMREIGYETKKK